MMKYVAGLLVLAVLTTARPQFTPEQLIVIRQHEAIALANTPSPIASVPGFAERPGRRGRAAAVARY